MALLLAEVARRHPADFLAMVIDGAQWHTSPHLVVPDNRGLIRLPPYSPELNPTEQVWDELREKEFHNKVFASLDALERQLVSGLVSLERTPEKVISLTAWPWIISLNLNAS
jgi:transposase